MTPSLIFFGSDQYSSIVLDALLSAQSYRLSAVVTDQKSDLSPVEKLAKKHNLKVLYYPDIPHSLITKDTLGLCASFDHLIPAKLITSFALRHRPRRYSYRHYPLSHLTRHRRRRDYLPGF